MSEVEMEIATAPVTRVKMGDIHEHPENPRYHSRAQIEELAASLKTHGYASISLTVSRSTGNIVKGNGMYDALTLLGCKEVDVVYKDMTPIEELQFLIRDNRLSELSSWDMPVLNADLAVLKDEGFELEDVSFDLEAVDTLESDYAKSQADNRVIEEDDPPEVSEEEPIAQIGDLWHLGAHRVLAGDSTKAEDVERVMDGAKADMVFTDPPYGMSKDFQNDDLLDMRAFHSKWMPICPACNAYLVRYDPKNLSDAIVPAESAWGHMVDYLHLYKPNDVAFPRQSWIRTSESMIVFGVPEYHEVKPYAHDTYLWNHTEKDKSFYHPSVKPMTVVCDVISRFAAEIIYDPFLGSGTTLIAADQLDRVCYGLEIAPKYCDVIVQRYVNHKGNSDDVWVGRDSQKIAWKQLNTSKLPKVI